MRIAWLPLPISKLLLVACAVLGGRLPIRPAGKRVGRRVTNDAARRDRLPSPAEQHRDWLKRSCLTDKDLPGELQGAERTIEFFDLDGEPVTYDLNGISANYAIRRLFVPDTGFTAGVEPENKYLSPASQPLHIYYPQNKTGFDWRKWAQDPSQRKIFVEGATKAACAVNFGFLAVGIQGCRGWSDSKRGHPLLLDFDEYNLDGCDVYWVPDRDRKAKAVQDVFQSGEALAFLLKERGARVHVVELPFLGEGKVGVDDFLSHFNETISKKAAKDALEKRLAETAEWQDHELNDGGNARRWVKMCGHRFRHAGKRWLEYVRGCWQDDGLLQHQETLIEMLEEMMTSARRNGNDALRKAIKPYITRPHVASSLALAESDPVVAATPSQFDNQPLWINCKEGTIELPTPQKGKRND